MKTFDVKQLESNKSLFQQGSGRSPSEGGRPFLSTDFCSPCGSVRCVRNTRTLLAGVHITGRVSEGLLKKGWRHTQIGGKFIRQTETAKHWM